MRKLAGTEAAVRSPGRLVADPVRWIGDHQVRLRSSQYWRDIRRACTVAAANPMVAQLPHVAAPSDRLIWDFRDAVRIGQTARPQTGQDGSSSSGSKPITLRSKSANSSAFSSSRSRSGSQLARAAS